MNATIALEAVAEIRRLYQDDLAFRRLADWFASRQRDSLQMPVRVASAKANLTEAEVRRVFKELDVLGCGRYVLGRRGAESRMVWEVSIQSLAHTARGEAEAVEEAINDQDLDAEEEFGWEEPRLRHSFTLRAGTQIEFSLPEDLTNKEAERLANFIRSLPFE